ncbi:sensor histidine kinase [Bacteroides sp. 224]|uniref:sensor histidine kinase n=1 Tax=Bacteroides sp. 224 TaxID=2302936 RepID=UPI0013D2B74E|nr:sensor histidine kinase [Bacteroides sp. 224]NDV64314.1 histidine kinase [Bacteroides sp. 224]
MKTSVVTKGLIIFWGAYITIAFTHFLLFQNLSFTEDFKTIDASLAGFYNILRLVFTPLSFIIGYYSIVSLLKNKRLSIYTFLFFIGVYTLLFFYQRTIYIYGPQMQGVFIWFTLGALFRIFFDWFKKQNKIRELEKQNMQSTLAMLRMQINPHFLFNTLNNIDSLIKIDPTKASQSLIKLSDIMRYMLYDSETEQVEMKQELEYMEEYITLEKLRLKNERFLIFEKEGQPDSLKVAPMLFIPFIENAFKHSVDSNIENGIHIKFVFSGKIIKFTCENKFDNGKVEKDATHGIGLETVRKRLNLLYAKKYRLDITQENGIFKVFLKINTDED